MILMAHGVMGDCLDMQILFAEYINISMFDELSARRIFTQKLKVHVSFESVLLMLDFPLRLPFDGIKR